MTQLEFLHDWLSIVVNVVCWTSLAFPIVTASFWPWWQSHWSQNVVIYEICIGLATLGTTVAHDWGLPAHSLLAFYWLMAISLTLIPVIVIWRTLILFRSQRSGAEPGIRERIRKQRSERTSL